jgi:hypothetical protein
MSRDARMSVLTCLRLPMPPRIAPSVISRAVVSVIVIMVSVVIVARAFVVMVMMIVWPTRSVIKGSTHTQVGYIIVRIRRDITSTKYAQDACEAYNP